MIKTVKKMTLAATLALPFFSLSNSVLADDIIVVGAGLAGLTTAYELE